MTHDPHALIEGAIIASYAIRAERAYIYIRGEAVHAARRCGTRSTRPTPGDTWAGTSSAAG